MSRIDKTPVSLRKWELTAVARPVFCLLRSSYNQILFRPRILQDVLEVDTRTTFLGEKVGLPIFICPCGMAKLS